MINCCWIDPNGKIHPVNFHRHGKYAQEILNDTTIHPAEALLRLAEKGWIHIGLAPFIAFKPYNALPEAQITALFVVLDKCTSGLIAQNIESYIHS